jgi:hypothetical protein
MEQLPGIIVNTKRENKLQPTPLHPFMLGLGASYIELNLTIFQSLKTSVKNFNKLQLKQSKMDNTLKIWQFAFLTKMTFQEALILILLNTFKQLGEDSKRNLKRNDYK